MKQLVWNKQNESFKRWNFISNNYHYRILFYLIELDRQYLLEVCFLISLLYITSLEISFVFAVRSCQNRSNEKLSFVFEMYNKCTSNEGTITKYLKSGVFSCWWLKEFKYDVVGSAFITPQKQVMDSYPFSREKYLNRLNCLVLCKNEMKNTSFNSTSIKQIEIEQTLHIDPMIFHWIFN